MLVLAECDFRFCFFFCFSWRRDAQRLFIDEYSIHATNLGLVSHFSNEISHHLHRFSLL